MAKRGAEGEPPVEGSSEDEDSFLSRRVRVIAELSAFEPTGDIRSDVGGYESILAGKAHIVPKVNSEKQIFDAVRARINELQAAGENDVELREAQLAALRKIVMAYSEHLG